MARTDDFQQARDLAAQELSRQKIEAIAQRAGFETIEGTALRVPFLDHIYHIRYPDFSFSDETAPDTQVPLQEQVLILHYLQGCRPILKNQWVAYREIPGAGFYFGAFVKRAVDPLKKTFGQNIDALRKAAARLGGAPAKETEAAYCFNVLPFAPLQMIIWQGDEEFPAEANILFDASVGDYLSPEDAAWLASLTVYKLIALSR